MDVIPHVVALTAVGIFQQCKEKNHVSISQLQRTTA